MRSRRTSPKAEATWEEGVSGRKEAPRPRDTGKHFPKAQPLGYDGHDARSHIPSTARQADRPPRSLPGLGEDTGPEQPVPRRTRQQTRKKIKTGGKQEQGGMPAWIGGQNGGGRAVSRKTWNNEEPALSAEETTAQPSR